MEAINDASKLVAQALALLKVHAHSDESEALKETIRVLEEALDKLIDKI